MVTLRRVAVDAGDVASSRPPGPTWRALGRPKKDAARFKGETDLAAAPVATAIAPYVLAMARKGKKTRRTSLGDHLAHPIPGVRFVKGPDKRRQVLLGRPGVMSRPLALPAPPKGEPGRGDEEASTLSPGATEHDVGTLWAEGLDAFESGERHAAAELWNKVLLVDPHCADAMLGLHALDPSRDELLRAMNHEIEGFGEMRGRFGRALTSTYRPVGFMIETLDFADDLRRALAIYEHRCGDESAANSLLEQSRPCTLTSAVWARIAFENRDYRRCLQICQKLERDVDIAADVDLMIGGSLLGLEMPAPAIEILQRSALNATDDEGEMHARYYLALAYEAEGLVDEAEEQLQLIYSLDVGFADVAARLGLASTEEPTPAPGGAASPEWDAIVDALTAPPRAGDEAEWDSLVARLAGDLATDPGIADNAGL